MTLDQTSLAHSFIINVIDIIDNKHLLNYFWTGKSIRLEELMNNDFVKLNVLFSHLWNTIFKTYPTKADFEDCIKRIVSPTTDKWFCQKITFDYNLLNRLISLNCFALLRFGVLPNADPNKLKSVFDECISRLSSRSFVENTLCMKWSYRYQKDSDNSSNTNDSIFKRFLKYYMHSDECTIDTCGTVSKMMTDHINFTGYFPDGVEIAEKHLKHMSAIEIQQYILHQNNRFLLQLATYSIITAINVKQVPEFLINTMSDTLNKHVCVLYIDDMQRTECLSQFNYRCNSKLLNVIPKICTKLLEVVSSPHDAFKSSTLCRDKRNCLVYYLNSELKEIKYKPDEYNMVVCSSTKFVDPLKSVYYLPEDGLGKDLFFKTYLTSNCPFKTPGDVRSHSVLYANFLAMYLQKHKQKINEVLMKPLAIAKSQNVVVLIDNRYNELSVVSSLITMYNLLKSNPNDDGWSLRVYTSDAAVEKYMDAFHPFLKGRVQICSEPMLECKIFHLEIYNAILKSAKFWKQLSAFDKCLIIQDDGMLVNAKQFSTFMQYDYVGAPWVDTPDNHVIKNEVNPEMVGNGGFSLRSVRKMIEVCETFQKEKKELFFHNINEIPEDVYFVKYLTCLGAKIAPKNIAKHFAVEQVYEEDICGFHKFWMYHQTGTVKKLFDTLLAIDA